jgi:hypothetical protein
MMQRRQTGKRPYPFDMFINNLGVMLAADQNGERLKTTRRTGQEATSPVVLEYASRDPFAERTATFIRPYFGMGERVQHTETSRFVQYCDGADTSYGGQAILGPLFSSLTLPTSPGAINQLLEFNQGGTRRLVAAATTGVWVKTANNDVQADWTRSKDLSGAARTCSRWRGSRVVGRAPHFSGPASSWSASIPAITGGGMARRPPPTGLRPSTTTGARCTSTRTGCMPARTPPTW